MTAYADHRSWQDVYVVPSDHGSIFIKFTAGPTAAFLLLSFKENEHG